MVMLLMAHNEDDLPCNEQVVCDFCKCVCWLGPRLSELRKDYIGPTQIECERCAVEDSKKRRAKGEPPVPVAHMGNPLS
jgi:hypothetical protein